VVFYSILRLKNIDIWFLSYLGFILKKLFRRNPAITHVYFCIADHFEPYWGNVSKEVAMNRVKRWGNEYISIARKHKDSNGKHPQHSFFYPIEEYDDEAMKILAEIASQGFGDVEIHLHHENDTEENLRDEMLKFTHMLHEKHDLLHKNELGEIEYAFIHGNWALDNSHPKGFHCGIDNELAILEKTGCYLDMTMPSAPSRTQTKKINSIYFAKGKKDHRKSHDTGINVKPGRWKKDNELLMVQGPLGLNWKSRKLGIFPRLEAGELSHDAIPTKERIKLWLKYAPNIQEVKDHIFIKLHTHGANDSNLEMLLEGGLEFIWTELENTLRDKPNYSLHYVTPREIYLKIKEISLENKQEKCIENTVVS